MHPRASAAKLAGAGLLGRSLARLQHTDLGFESERLLFVGLDPGIAFTHETSVAEWKAHYARILDAFAERLPREPGIVGATSTLTLPVTARTRSPSARHWAPRRRRCTRSCSGRPWCSRARGRRSGWR